MADEIRPRSHLYAWRLGRVDSLRWGSGLEVMTIKDCRDIVGDWLKAGWQVVLPPDDVFVVL